MGGILSNCYRILKCSNDYCLLFVCIFNCMRAKGEWNARREVPGRSTLNILLTNKSPVQKIYKEDNKCKQTNS